MLRGQTLGGSQRPYAVVQIDRESAQRLSGITHVCVGEAICIGLGDCTHECSQPVMTFVNLPSGLAGKTAVPVEPRQQLGVFGFARSLTRRSKSTAYSGRGLRSRTGLRCVRTRHRSVWLML